ncbi:hypothetical protein ACQ33O_01985 [Ferruginibacter sp. SUN002]|uniref:hypothetical protein n=1 Tax=Ferruginibacter sp. SUN002 TaxID=2937789 RepID=UPI003D35ECA4
MKKLIVLSILAIAVYSCSKKATPSTTEEKSPAQVENKEAPSAPVAIDIAAGKTVYEAKCGRCHALPVTTDFTAVRWVGIMGWMAPKAKLTDIEKANTLAYVQANAKQ